MYIIIIIIIIITNSEWSTQAGCSDVQGSPWALTVVPGCGLSAGFNNTTSSDIPTLVVQRASTRFGDRC